MKRTIHMLCRTGLLCRIGALPFLILLMTAGTVFAQDHTAQRSLHRQYPATLGTTLEVQNKYGKIQVVTWEKDSVAIEVELSLTESSASKLRKLKDDISIDFARTNDYIIARSRFKSESGRIASELKNVSHTISGSNKHVEIDYTVYLPEYLDVVLSNKFGDIYIDDLDGRVNIELSNGALKASNLQGSANISLSFATGMIKSLGTSTMKLIYSDLALGEAGQLDLDSKSSKLNADSINVLKINSRRDKLYFQRVEYLYGDANFTEVWVYDFLRESDLYMKYGKLTIEHVDPAFSKIYVESDYADISLYFDPRSAFSFDILHHEKSVLRLPEGQLNAQESFDGQEHLRTTGNLGNEDSESMVTIDALQKCFINLSVK